MHLHRQGERTQRNLRKGLLTQFQNWESKTERARTCGGGRFLETPASLLNDVRHPPQTGFASGLAVRASSSTSDLAVLLQGRRLTRGPRVPRSVFSGSSRSADRAEQIAQEHVGREPSSQTRREIHGGLLSCRIQSTPRASVQIDGEKTPTRKVDSEVPPVRLEEATTSPSRNEKPHAPMRTREGSLRRRVPSPSRTGRHVCPTFTTAALYGSGEKHDGCLVLSPSALATYRNDGKNQPDTREKIRCRAARSSGAVDRISFTLSIRNSLSSCRRERNIFSWLVRST